MKRWAVPLAFLVLALSAGVYYEGTRLGGSSGSMAPDFQLNDLNGRPYRLSELRGKVVFLNLWATWCPPCREEMPAMERLYRKFKDQDLVVLAVSEDESVAAVRQYAEQGGFTFPILLDTDGRLPTRYGVTGYPETFIIDRGGQVIQHIVGPEDWDSTKAFTYFSQLLERKGDSPQTAGAARPNG